MEPISWTSFNKILLSTLAEETIIGYAQFTPMSPANPDVVQESVKYCMAVSEELGSEYCILTCDQAIYEIVLGLQTKDPEVYDKLILRMGGFHIAMNFMGAIGNLMRQTGLEDLFTEGGICLPGTANKIMSGKDYYQMLRAHTIIGNVMSTLQWEAFEECAMEHFHEVEEYSSLSDDLCRLVHAQNVNTDCGEVREAYRQTEESVVKLNELIDTFIATRGVPRHFGARGHSPIWGPSYGEGGEPRQLGGLCCKPPPPPGKMQL